MEKILKISLSTLISSLAVVWIIYAANITLLTQTAVTGDKITATWVNAVNTKLNLVWNSTCTYTPNFLWWSVTYKNYEVFRTTDNCSIWLSQCINWQIKVIDALSNSNCN